MPQREIVKVKMVMTRNLVYAKPETSIKEVLNLMVDHHISGIPVVDDQLNLLGFVPERTLLIRTRLNIEGLPPSHTASAFAERQKKLYGQTAREIMNSEVITIDENADILELVDLILTSKISRLPVLRGGKKLVGMITRSDILRVIRDYDLSTVEQKPLDDLDIERLVIQNLKKELSAYNIHVQVRHGILTLTGSVEKAQDLPKIEQLARETPGIKSVYNQLMVDSSLI